VGEQVNPKQNETIVGVDSAQGVLFWVIIWNGGGQVSERALLLGIRDHEALHDQSLEKMPA
jgi:hypothetical protein